jgi:hypothetical protein
LDEEVDESVGERRIRNLLENQMKESTVRRKVMSFFQKGYIISSERYAEIPF